MASTELGPVGPEVMDPTKPHRQRTRAAAGDWRLAAQVRDGADSFVVRDGCIAVQTIHYTVETTTNSP